MFRSDILFANTCMLLSLNSTFRNMIVAGLLAVYLYN